ncbi:hypothetical protein EN46_26585 [Citrobacter amalonaticus]
MTTITKEWLQKVISGIETIRDDTPSGLDDDGSSTLAALKMALASMDAEPVYQCEFCHYDTDGLQWHWKMLTLIFFMNSGTLNVAVNVVYFTLPRQRRLCL